MSAGIRSKAITAQAPASCAIFACSGEMCIRDRQIPTPGTLEYQRTGSTRRYHPGYECKWATNTVVHILENREYTGCLVNFKTEKPSYKVKHSVENPIEKQAIFENHHEPIIDTETWAVSYTHLAMRWSAVLRSWMRRATR